MRKSPVAAVIAALLLATFAAPSHGQTAVGVTLATGTGSRTLFVEDMLGQELTSLDFADTRSLPFRVRVVDSDFDRQAFNVSATMTNMYLDEDGTLTYDTQIDAADVSLGSQLQPLNIFDVDATVRPLVDTVTTVTDATLCSLLGLTGSGCEISLSGLVGTIQTVELPVDLDNLPALPLVPQANETGAFTNAEYTAGVGAADPSPGGAAATARRLVAGGVGPSGLLDEIEGLLVTTPVGALVPVESVVEALVAAYPLIGTLPVGTVSDLIANTTGDVVPLTLNEILAQSGTYMSLPTLNVNVPAGTTAGDYRGTLVVTALQ